MFLWNHRGFCCLLAGVLVAAAGPAAADPPPLPLGRADLGADDIVFSSSGDLWVVSRTGGTARPLTQGPDWDDAPLLSPDGRTIVFQRSRSGAPDLYVMPLAGGDPRRLTWHPKTELPRDWSADGRRVLFTSDREGDGLWRLYTIGLDDPWEEPLDLPRGMHAAWSPDGARLAYAENGYDPGWLRYRGGAAPRIWIVDLQSAAVTRIPGGPEGDWQPMWVGDTIYFLSERSGTANLHAYDTGTAPPFVDGGEMAVPSRAFFDPAGEWGIENRGVAPDIAVEILPADWRAGRDPQLERAVSEALRAVKAATPPVRRRPEGPPSAP